MTDDANPDDDARALFHKAVADARRLKHDKIVPHRQRIRPKPLQRWRDEQAVLAESLDPLSDMAHIEVGDELLFARNGVQQSVMRKLRRGHYRIEAELDLHRMTSQQAYAALSAFIQACKQRQYRCVRVIHGKGLGSKESRPVLKGKVNQWLARWDDVLAFCSARPCDGGTGAAYILLRRA